MRQKAVPSATAEQHVREIRRATRRRYSAEEKIRIVLSGLRGEHSIAELCRREGIAEGLYYAWSKEFLEAGKKRLAGDTERQASSGEVSRPAPRDERPEAQSPILLTRIVCSKKHARGWGRPQHEILGFGKARDHSPRSSSRTCRPAARWRCLGSSRPTFYRWYDVYRRFGEAALEDHRAGPRPGLEPGSRRRFVAR